MSNLNHCVERINVAFEELKRAFSAMVSEIEIATGAAKALRDELKAAHEREKQLRDLLRDRGLASYDDEKKAGTS